jgi:hypothetical protein
MCTVEFARGAQEGGCEQMEAVRCLRRRWHQYQCSYGSGYHAVHRPLLDLLSKIALCPLLYCILGRIVHILVWVFNPCIFFGGYRST